MNDVVRTTLARIPRFAGRSLERLSVQPLESLTNRSYRITLDGERYVLRIAGAGTGRFIDRPAELHNARLAASIGVAPEVLFFDAEDGTMLTRFIADSVTLDARRMRDPATLSLAARTMKRLHESGLAFAGRMELFPKIDEYLALIDERRADDCGLHAARGRAEALRPAFEQAAAPIVPCHIDPTPANFLLARAAAGLPALYLIDWEYAAMGEAAWDLAGLSIEAGFDEADDRRLLDAYHGQPSATDIARFRAHRALLPLVAASWAVAHAADTGAGAPLIAMARQRVAEFHARAAGLASG